MSKKAVEKRKKRKQTKVMAFGTFDGLHPGHFHFFKQARDVAAHGFLIVSVARDQNVLRIKGKLPVLNERKRAAVLKKTKLLDRVVLGGLVDYLSHIVKIRPDIIALGYDQKDYVKNLKKDLEQKNLAVKIVRLKPYKAHIYKNALLRPRK
ncbi:MAG: adenylyltransferase/cytidyltransferase family protein [bacterium]|nr:adenylyltransferase/cytidyltransferase family protein [bacterium]